MGTMWERIDESIQIFEERLVIFWNRNTLLVRIWRPFQRNIYHHCFLTCLILLLLFSIAIFFPLFMSGYFDGQPFNNGEDNFRYAIVSNEYSKWQIVCVFVSIPMLLELLYDIEKLYGKYADIEEWLSSLLLALSLSVPNLIMYCLVEYRPGADISTTVAYLQFVLLVTQRINILSSLLFLMFGHKADYAKNEDHPLLNFSIERRTVNILIFITLGAIFFTAASSFRSFNPSLIALSLAFVCIALFLLLFLLLRILYMLIRQVMKYNQFKTHHHLSDFLYSIAILSIAIVDFAIAVRAGKAMSTKDAKMILRSFVAIQITITCFVQLIPGQKSKKLAVIKHDKLESRLNLIRYVSHEMRTPLNTAFMGLSILHTELQTWKWKLNSIQAEMMKERASTSLLRVDSEYSNHSGKGGGFAGMIRDFSNSRATPRTAAGVTMDDNSFTPILTGRSNFNDYNANNNNNAASMEHKLSFITLKSVEEFMETTGQVSESCKVALSTLDDLLTFDKIDEQKLVIELHDINPWTFLAAAAKPFAINARESHVHFNVSVDDAHKTNWVEHCVIQGDHFKLSQVVRNLVSNALKFTPINGRVDVTLIMQPQQLQTSTKDYIRIAVKDTGAGISVQNQKKLFGQYVQFNAASLQQGKGSGLGLWITKSIVEMHKGHIGCFSEGEGKGTTFYVDLPVYKTKKNSPRTAANSTNHTDPTIGSLSRANSRAINDPDRRIKPGAMGGSISRGASAAHLDAPTNSQLEQALGLSSSNVAEGGTSEHQLPVGRVIKTKKSPNNGERKKKQRKFMTKNNRELPRQVIDPLSAGEENEDDQNSQQPVTMFARLTNFLTANNNNNSDSAYELQQSNGSGAGGGVDDDNASIGGESVNSLYRRGSMMNFLNNPVKFWKSRKNLRDNVSERSSSFGDKDSNQQPAVSIAAKPSLVRGSSIGDIGYVDDVVEYEDDQFYSGTPLGGSPHHHRKVPFVRSNSREPPNAAQPSVYQLSLDNNSVLINHYDSSDDSHTQPMPERGLPHESSLDSESDRVLERPITLRPQPSPQQQSQQSIAKSNNLLKTVHQRQAYLSINGSPDNNSSGQGRILPYLKSEDSMDKIALQNAGIRQRSGGSNANINGSVLMNEHNADSPFELLNTRSSNDEKIEEVASVDSHDDHYDTLGQEAVSVRYHKHTKVPSLYHIDSRLTGMKGSTAETSQSLDLGRKGSYYDSDSNQDQSMKAMGTMQRNFSSPAGFRQLSRLSPSGAPSPPHDSAFTVNTGPNSAASAGVGSASSFAGNSPSSINLNLMPSPIAGLGLALQLPVNSSSSNALQQQQQQLTPTTQLLQSEAKNDDDILNDTFTPDARSKKAYSPTPPSRAVRWETGLRILVVDDSAPNRKICAKLLTAHKHQVQEAHDGVNCLEVYDEIIRQNKKIDLILMDDNMPRMNGSQASQALRDRGYNGIIFAVTGDVYQEAIDRFISNGANKVLSKPLNIDVLRRGLDEYLPNSK